MELDNIKMWESILKELWHYPLNSWLVECIKAALREQGLHYNSGTKKIESIEPKFTHITKSDWFICIKEINNFEVGKVYCIGKDSIIAVKEYFRPATPEEIPHEDYHWNGKIDKKEATGVLKEMLDNIDEEELAKTREEMMKESSDGELSELEKAVLDIIPDHNTHTDSVEEFARRNAKRILSVARKQIASEFDGLQYQMVDSRFDNVPLNERFRFDSYFYQEGIRDTLKAIKGE